MGGAKAAEIAEAARAEALARVEGRVAVLVVLRLLVGVAQDLIGLADLLEPLLAGLVAGVQVRMILLGQLAVGLADLVVRGALLQAQDLVVISFLCHRDSPNS